MSWLLQELSLLFAGPGLRLYRSWFSFSDGCGDEVGWLVLCRLLLADGHDAECATGANVHGGFAAGFDGGFALDGWFGQLDAVVNLHLLCALDWLEFQGEGDLAFALQIDRAYGCGGLWCLWFGCS